MHGSNREQNALRACYGSFDHVDIRAAMPTAKVGVLMMIMVTGHHDDYGYWPTAVVDLH